MELLKCKVCANGTVNKCLGLSIGSYCFLSKQYFCLVFLWNLGSEIAESTVCLPVLPPLQLTPPSHLTVIRDLCPGHNCSNWPAHHTLACSALSFYGSHPALPAFLQAIPLGHPLHVYWFSSNCVVRASIHPVLGLVLGKQGTIYPQPFLRTQIPSLWLVWSLIFLWWHCFFLSPCLQVPCSLGRDSGAFCSPHHH